MAEAETILVAEDDEIVREVTVRMLKKAGYSTLPAEDGEQAVHLFRKHGTAVNLVLMDAMMPKMTGHEAFLRIKKIRPEIPVVFCTGYDPVISQSGVTPWGESPILRKPVDKKVLLDTVAAALSAPSQDSQELAS